MKWEIDDDAHDREEAIICKHETKDTWDDDNHRPPVLQEVEVVDPIHDERQPDDTGYEEEDTPEEFAKRIHRDKYKLGIRSEELGIDSHATQKIWRSEVTIPHSSLLIPHY